MGAARVTIIGCGAVLVILGICAIFMPHIIVNVLSYKLVYGIDNPTFSSDGRLQISDMAQGMQGGLVMDCVQYGLVVVSCLVSFIGVGIRQTNR